MTTNDSPKEQRTMYTPLFSVRKYNHAADCNGAPVGDFHCVAVQDIFGAEQEAHWARLVEVHGLRAAVRVAA